MFSYLIILLLFPRKCHQCERGLTQLRHRDTLNLMRCVPTVPGQPDPCIVQTGGRMSWCQPEEMEWVCCGTTELLIELLAGRTTTKIPLPDQWRYYPRNPYYDYNVVVRSASDSYFESKPKIVTTPAPQHPPIIHQKPRMNKLLPSVTVLQLLSGGFIQHGNFSESLRLSSNVVLVKDGPCYLVVNTGLPYQKNDIIKNLASAGATSTDVQFLIITSALPQFLGSLNLFQSAQLIMDKHFVYRDHILQGIIQEDAQIETCSRNTYLFATPGPTANSVTLIAKNVPSMGRVAIAELGHRIPEMVCENLMVSMNENSNQEPKPTVTILGCGIMGSGIAQVFLSSGYFVNLYGRSEASCMSAVKKIESSLSRSLIRKNKEAGNKLSDQVLISLLNEQMQRIRQFTQISSAVGSANFIIESVVEDLKTKLDLFDEVQKYCRRDAIILTNTSSIRLSDLLPVIANPENFGGLHFFNPVPAMKLVEIAVTSQTSNKVVEILENVCLDIGKKSVRCRDTDGFIVNRLLVPFLVDAIRMLERGDARKEDIDAAMKFGASHPMGPLELCDYVGLDTLKSIIEIWHSKMPEDCRFKPCSLLSELVESGKLGRKTKQGLYSYP